ncbi:50S ribosomal protein L18 [Candidatus Uhrbacteria bacterium RIFCSPHIGHO2_02_FULL_57_19]|uniref:Large ribosomal subunit protein uL18 n=1 Tax=Candidatus Uhrbacteria bacterium RIFCSPHIGHO2_02_FULL_57_19 TaxID=1802391 RepID=A0A1F7U7J1_9BACT|nr:MAG: 50S ribosomal protein L18 [Candidatus Uhrbacteria bacterium RIFCSPHIGHO2_02_FULL_57_19]
MKVKNSHRAKRLSRERRHRRVRAKVFGTADRPRLSVYRSLDHLWMQLIDDAAGRTLVSASDLELGKKKPSVEGLTARVAAAFVTGEALGKKAMAKGITTVVFDRGGFAFHGRIKAAAEGARAAGLKF